MSLDQDYYKRYIMEDVLINVFKKQIMTGDQIRGFLVGNAIMRLAIYDQKNGVEDLNDAQAYVKRVYQLDVDSGLYEDAKPYDPVNVESGFVRGKQLTGYLREKSILNLYKYLENKPDSGDLIRETTVLIGLLAERFK